jgi:hypothetical protein
MWPAMVSRPFIDDCDFVHDTVFVGKINGRQQRGAQCFEIIAPTKLIEIAAISPGNGTYPGTFTRAMAKIAG